VAAEDRPGSGGEQVGTAGGQRLQLLDGFAHRYIGMSEARSRAVQPDLEPDVGACTAAL
jgi:hypothetical protein